MIFCLLNVQKYFNKIISFVLIVFLPNDASANRDEFVSETIEKSSLSVALQEVAKIPVSLKERKAGKVALLNSLVPAGDGTGRFFVNDMMGRLYVLENGKPSEYLNLKRQIAFGFLEEGFTYFAFHPEFARNGLFYTVSSEKQGKYTPDFVKNKDSESSTKPRMLSQENEVIREWKATDPSANIFSGTSREILRIVKSTHGHHIGQIGFNPNSKFGETDFGMLYIAIGDGGAGDFSKDTNSLENAQDLSSPRGKILRINPLGNNGLNGKYGIPKDNPFAKDKNSGVLGEIWAYGFRNPHRFSWDRGGDGKMIIVDVGEASVEEVNLGVKGANYGWGNREGAWVVDKSNAKILTALPKDDSKYGYTYPVAQYTHQREKDGFLVAITGGYVYRGKSIPELNGQYIFADFGNDGRFFHVPVDDLNKIKMAKVKELRLFSGGREVTFLGAINNIRSQVRFGEDEKGELYVITRNDDVVRKLVQVSSAVNHNVAQGITSDIEAKVEGKSKVFKLAGGFTFTEGPVWHSQGFLLFSDIPKNIIYKWKPDTGASVFQHLDQMPNGNAIDAEGRLVTACHSGKLQRTEKDGKITILAERFEGKLLNSPNDVVIRSDGSIYFTDPPYGLGKRHEMLGFYGVFRLSLDGSLSVINKTMIRPNGIAFSLDERKLYVSDSEKKNIRVFDISAEGTLSNEAIFADLSNTVGKGVPDGLKLDGKGNVYCSGPQGIWIFSPTGKLLDKIFVPEVVTNFAWGDQDRKTLYITAGGSLYSTRPDISN